MAKDNSKIKCYFVTGSGRCGTKLFAKLFSLSENSVCEHEKLFRHISMVKFYRDNDCSSYLEDINSHVVPKVESYIQMDKSYGISSGHLYFSIHYLYRVFGRSARFILLVRRPEEFVRSALARGFFDPDHPNSCIQIFPNPSDDMYEKWDKVSPFEKCLWYWRLVNQFVLDEFRRMPKDIYRIVRIEDVNVGLVKQLCEFLELSDIRTEAIEETLAQRVNASPGLGDESDVNPYSLPSPLEPAERWDTSQLELLESYTKKLREQLYGLDFPFKGLCDGKAVVKRVMLIRPWNYHDEGVAEHDLSREWRNGPYNLLCLASQLKNAGIPFRLVDLEPILVKVRGDDSKCLENLDYEITAFRPDIIGVSFFSYQFLEVDRIVKYIKAVCHKNRLEPVLIAGGIHASVEPRQTLNELGFDYVFVGEADAGIIELGRGKVPENIPGIVTPHTTTIQKGQAVEDLNSLPFVDWSLCDYKFYSYLNSAKISGRPVRTLDLSMSRGCLNRCGFCAYSALSKLRFYSPEYLVDNIAHMLSSYGVDSIYFIDSSIGNNRDVLEGFCKKFVQRNLQYSCEWYANMRADQIDESLLKLMWAAGCRSLFYGFESGSQRILDLMNKRCTVEQNVKAAEIHNRLGFLYHASMVLGYPGETEQDIKLTFDFIEKIRPPSIGINWYVPLPGSRDYNRLKKNGKLQVQDPHEWRRIGEVLTTGRVYANIEEKHFRQLFREAQTLVSRITAKDLNTWAGGHPSVTKPKAHSIEQTPPRVERNTVMSEINPTCFSEFGVELREKWRELPATRQGRKFSSEMLEWSDEELLAYWEECKQQTCTPEVRGWYQELYKNEFAGLEIADVGPGVGLDGIFFAKQGARITFVDIVEDNLTLLKRICKLKGVEADYYFIDDFFNFHFSKEFDAFVCIGSLINAPFEFMKRQIEAMSKFLKVNGKVLMLAYPRERYLQSGAQDFAEFGKMTDGERTPWAEWYDDEKVEVLFGPNFKLNWSRNFGEDNIEFNWFELTKVRCDVYGERKKEYGSTKLRSATHQFTCHGQTPQPTFGQQEAVGTACATEPKVSVEPQQESSITIPSVHIQHLHEELGFAKPINYPTTSLNKPLEQWKMEVDDAPIFRYIYRNIRPRRHLEFGTWQGAGTLYCLEECDATVWSINLLAGEVSQDGSVAYGIDDHERASAQEWAKKMGLGVKDWPQTDSLGYIGRFYLEKGLGSRVCQIYGDSTKWDISNYPPGFFDTALIDGGHQKDIVINDTAKAFELLRSGGLIMWHDFCPPIYDKFETTLGVMRAIHQQWEWINEQTLKLFWIYPSWILVGVKK